MHKELGRVIERRSGKRLRSLGLAFAKWNDCAAPCASKEPPGSSRVSGGVPCRLQPAIRSRTSECA